MSSPDSELALLIDRFMRSIHFGLQAQAADFDVKNVGPGGGVILLTIADMGRPGLQDLTRRVARDKSQMTRAIRTLESKGLVERSVSPQDARVSLISLTAEGQTVVARLQDAVAGVIDRILGPVSPRDRDLFKQILRQADL